MYCEVTIRRKAYEIGYQVEKGFQHWQGEFVYHDSYGDRYSGYMVKNLYKQELYTPEVFAAIPEHH